MYHLYSAPSIDKNSQLRMAECHDFGIDVGYSVLVWLSSECRAVGLILKEIDGFLVGCLIDY